ncbi:hypothetical protein [Dinghuibacter silviterrae]|uniref:Uncharacterized protein n=1 Tax=Dinghuibacter silviterrae TaxID=1539049 RepID=A0A4R8DV62_9BACT|nr:hypothetical protein [Dinghuibacter silviterrae]TDX02302.1 hypothetical protein EDB95_3357 [Dinghuibacter silviterrae]
MRYLILALLFLPCGLLPGGLSAQRLAELHAHEDSLAQSGNLIVNGTNASDRFVADSQFTRTLVRALKIPYSFNYPFDSVENVSRLYAPDSSFRVFTWEIMIDPDNYRRHGAIQMRTPDGSLKLYALIDRTDMMDRPLDTVTSNDYWVGNIYYKIVLKKFQNRKYYTLLGYDEHNEASTRKWIDVLTFDENNHPVFGGQYFTFPAGDPVHPSPSPDRYMIEYKKGANARVQYDPDLDLLIFDHLISESNEPEKRYTLVPDGDYEGFRWVNGRWVHINKVFNQKLQNGQAPVPAPLKTPPKIQGKG